MYCMYCAMYMCADSRDEVVVRSDHFNQLLQERLVRNIPGTKTLIILHIARIMVLSLYISMKVMWL